MSSQTLPQTSALQREPSQIMPWQAMREYQNGVVQLWRMSLNGWPFFLPLANVGRIASVSVQQEPSTDVARSDGEPEGLMPSQIEDSPAPPEPVDQPKDAQSSNAGPQPKKTRQARQKNGANGEKPTRRHTRRQPVRAKKSPERTGRAGPAVMAGLRHRSYSAKLAAVSAMTTNKKLRTEEAIPLLQRIVDNQTIQRRDPELRTAAKTVLQQSRREVSNRSPSPSKRSPAKRKSHRGAAKG